MFVAESIGPKNVVHSIYNGMKRVGKYHILKECQIHRFSSHYDTRWVGKGKTMETIHASVDSFNLNNSDEERT